MTYERQRTVKDNEEYHDGTFNDDTNEPEATKGVLVHAVCGKVSKSMKLNENEALIVGDEQVLNVLMRVLEELEKINMYNEMMHDGKID